jgi:hypothetical protein
LKPPSYSGWRSRDRCACRSGPAIRPKQIRPFPFPATAGPAVPLVWSFRSLSYYGSAAVADFGTMNHTARQHRARVPIGSKGRKTAGLSTASFRTGTPGRSDFQMDAFRAYRYAVIKRDAAMQSGSWQRLRARGSALASRPAIALSICFAANPGRRLSVTRKDVRRLKRVSCPAGVPPNQCFSVRLERCFSAPA